MGHPAFVTEPEVASRRAEFVNQVLTQILKPNLLHFFTARLKVGPDTKPGGSHTDSEGLDIEAAG